MFDLPVGYWKNTIAPNGAIASLTPSQTLQIEIMRFSVQLRVSVVKYARMYFSTDPD